MTDEIERAKQEMIQNIIAISMAGLGEPLWETRQKVAIELDKWLALFLPRGRRHTRMGECRRSDASRIRNRVDCSLNGECRGAGSGRILCLDSET